MRTTRIRAQISRTKIMQLNLKRLRKTRSLTQEQLAILCDAWLKSKSNATTMHKCSLRKIQKLEQGYYRFLEFDLIDALCNVLNCNAGELIKVERV
jgi:DNA-binding Xre family transcriptional regulator